MATSLLQKIDRERQITRDSTEVEAAKMARVYLAPSWPRPVELPWCLGRGHKSTLVILRPGHSVDQPLDKVRSWFGPFDLFKVYEQCTNEKELEGLREIIAVESARYLNRYDYERLAGEGYKPKMTPTAPHRSPDVTITVLNSDGSTEEPVRLHEVYGIGEFDDIQFEKRESLEEITARYERELAAKDEAHRAELHRLETGQAELAGLVKGLIVTIGEKPNEKDAKVEA